jgi:pSer/pThr/pTyr-binding forkhead associated (FHA) protein
MSGTVLLLLRLILTAALYTFLGYALLILWRDLQRQKEVLTSQQVPAIELLVAVNEATQAHQFNEPEVILGRDPLCDCTLQSETVSARHARLSYHHGQWWLEDLGSKNGTYLNSETVTEPTVVTKGDHFRCGEATLTITDA